MNAKKIFSRLLNSQQSGLIIIIFLIGLVLSLCAGSHIDNLTGRSINNFFNSYSLMQTATDASFFAIMAIGATMVIISGGIDLSIGSIYALSGIAMAMFLRSASGALPPFATVSLGLGISLGVGLLCGLINGAMITGLKVHPFIITLGTMWVFRGIAFVASKAESILVPDSLTAVTKATFFGTTLHPVPMFIMLAVMILGAVYLTRTVMGRYIYAVGGNAEAGRYAGLRLNRILIGVYVVSGLTAGIAAFVGTSYYGSASCADATGYELYVIASAVVGGASLSGGKGSALSAMLGAILIILIRQSIRTLHFDQNYEWIIIGCAIIVAVVFDRLNAKFTARRILMESVRAKEPEQQNNPTERK